MSAQSQAGGWTPGPWQVGIDSDWSVDTGSGNVSIHVGPDGYDPVAIVVHTDEFFNCSDNVEADARLIAAAPQMLEACNDALKAFKLLRIGALAFMPESVEVIDAHIDELEYIIAKATGQ